MRDPAGRPGSSSGQQPAAASEVVVLSDDDEVEEEDYHGRQDDGDESGEDSGAGEGEGHGIELTDEELALQLHAEEHHAHMLELAGFGTNPAYLMLGSPYIFVMGMKSLEVLRASCMQCARFASSLLAQRLLARRQHALWCMRATLGHACCAC